LGERKREALLNNAVNGKNYIASMVVRGICMECFWNGTDGENPKYLEEKKLFQYHWL